MKCNKCNLCKNTDNPFLMGRGKKHAKIMFIQDAPTQLESRKGKQFAGKTFQRFKELIESRDIDLTDIYWTSVVKCPLSDENAELTMAQCKECLDYLYTEIDIVDPEIVVPMGNQALKATLGKTAITKHRGNAQQVEINGKTRIVIPIIHPKQAMKKPIYKDFIIKDLDNLADIYESGMNEVSGVSYNIIETLEDALEQIEKFQDSEWLSFDLETTGKNPFEDTSKIVCISLCDKPYTGCVIPLYHRESPIVGDDRETVVEKLKTLLENSKIKKCAHNGKFDIEWLSHCLDINVANFCFDTMLAHYLAVSEEQGTQGLKALAWEFTDMGGYDNELDEYRNKLPEAIKYNYDNIPWNILSKYAVADVDCCLRLKDIFMPMIEENEKWVTIMNDIMMPGSYALMEVEKNGMLMAEDVIDQYESTYTAELARIKERLTSYPEVVQLERSKREKYAEREAIAKIPKKDRTAEEQKKFEKYKSYKDFVFNWNSVNQLRELLFDKLKLETSITTDKGEKSTNEEALIEMSEQHEIPKLMLELRKIDTLNNMFIKKLPDMRDSRGLVHSSYNLTGTVTGRLASENPNMQQLPRKSEDPMSFQYQNEPKSLFISRYGKNGIIMNADYAALEMRIAGVISEDKALLDAFLSGQDLHKSTASIVWGVPVDEVSKTMRTNAKAVNFGIIYGKSGVTFARDLYYDPSGQNPDKTSDWDDAREQGLKLVDDYLNAFEGLSQWLRDTKKFAKRHGYVETMFGRRRRLPDLKSTIPTLQSNAERQSINAPIQGTGSDLTMLSIINICKYFKENNMKSMIIATVHDSIVLDVYLDELVTVAENVKRIMEHVHEDYIDTPVPIRADLEMGNDYGHVFEVDLETIQGFKSKEDYFAWHHEQSIAKYKKEIKACKSAGYDLKGVVEYLNRNSRPVKELKNAIVEIYSEEG